MRCIWFTMQVHMAMDKLVWDRMKYNPAISAVFVCFLTKQTGSNVGDGLGSQMFKMEDQLKPAENATKEAIKEANEVTKRTSLAGTSADTVKSGLAQLFTKN